MCFFVATRFCVNQCLKYELGEDQPKIIQMDTSRSIAESGILSTKQQKNNNFEMFPQSNENFQDCYCSCCWTAVYKVLLIEWKLHSSVAHWLNISLCQKCILNYFCSFFVSQPIRQEPKPPNPQLKNLGIWV